MRPPQTALGARASHRSVHVRLIPSPMSDTAGGARGPRAEVRGWDGIGMPEVAAALSTGPGAVLCPGSDTVATQSA